EIPVRTRDDTVEAASSSRNREFDDRPGRRDPADLVSAVFREPDRAVGTQAKNRGPAVRRRYRKLGDSAFNADARDLVAEKLRNPHSIVRTGRDSGRLALRRWDLELGERVTNGDFKRDRENRKERRHDSPLRFEMQRPRRRKLRTRLVSGRGWNAFTPGKPGR